MIWSRIWILGLGLALIALAGCGGGETPIQVAPPVSDSVGASPAVKAKPIKPFEARKPGGKISE